MTSPVERDLVPDDEPDAGETERETEPLPRHDALAEPGAGDHDRQHRLQPDQHRRHAGRHAAGERDEHAAEIDAVHEPRRDGDVPRLRRAFAAIGARVASATTVISTATSAKR